MNIDEIRAEIPKANLSRVSWIREHGEPDYPGNNYPFEDIQNVMAKLVDLAYEAGYNEGYDHGFDVCYTEGYNAAAKDPKAWYVLDKNGDQMHIGDKVKYFNEVLTVFAINGGWIVPDESCRTIQADMCEKVIPDTREKIKEELQNLLFGSEGFFSWSRSAEVAEQFISRIEALERD